MSELPTGSGGANQPDSNGQGGPNNKKNNGRHQGNGNRNAGKYSSPFKPTAKKFEGKVDGLKGHFYDCSSPQDADRYVKTTKEIAEYVGREYPNGKDIKVAVETGSAPAITAPTARYANATAPTEVEQLILKEKVREYVKREQCLEDNLSKRFNLVKGQCTESMTACVEAHTNYKQAHESSNGLLLLAIVKSVAFNFQDKRYLPLSIHHAKRRFYTLSQGRQNTTAQYYETFKNTLDVLESQGGGVGNDFGIRKQVAKQKGVSINAATQEQANEISDAAREQYLAVAFLLGSDRTRFGELITDLENNFAQGVNNYPTTLVNAYKLLVRWKPRQTGRTGPDQQGNKDTQNTKDNANGTAFTTVGRDKSHIKCFKCGNFGHYKGDAECPEADNKHTNVQTEAQPNDDGVQMLTAGVESGEYDDQEIRFSFCTLEGVALYSDEPKANRGRIPATWILLDNQSTVDVFHNAELLVNVRSTPESITIHTNAGASCTNLVGDLPGYGTVWYHSKGIANILSLKKVKDKYAITYNSLQGNAFHVQKPDGTTRVFHQSPSGLYYMDAADNAGSAHALAQTVEDKKDKYTNEAYSRALVARGLQQKIGRPSTRDYIAIIEKGLLPNCPINRDDIMAAEDIFGPDLGSLKGKTTRRAPSKVRATPVSLPPDILTQYKDVTLAIDVMYVNSLPFLITTSRHIKFGTSEYLPDQKKTTIRDALSNVQRVYCMRGFAIETVLADGQFQTVATEIAALGMNLNTASQDEHVPEIERYIRTIKERVRAVFNTLPYKSVPPIMTKEMVAGAVFWLNTFPPNDGVSSTISPRGLITGFTVDYTKHCRLGFGDYVQTHEEHDNSMAPRTTGAIALRPTGNSQGGYYFMSLSSGRRLNRNRWTSLPMPHDVIERVEILARRAKADRGLGFHDRYTDTEDIEDDASYTPSIAPEDEYAEDDLHPTDDADDPVAVPAPAGVNDHNDPLPIQPLHDGDGGGNNPNAYEPHNDNYYAPIADGPDNDEHNNDGQPALDGEEPPGDGEEPPEDTSIEGRSDDSRSDGGGNPPPHPDHRDLGQEFTRVEREMRNLSYGDGPPPTTAGRTRSESRHLTHTQTGTRVPDIDQYITTLHGRSQHGASRPRYPSSGSMPADLEHTVLTQYSMKKGLKLFKERGTAAVLKEMRQLHERRVALPTAASELSQDAKKAALPYLMFLKEKRCGTIKGRGCADGRKQRAASSKHDATAPTVSLEALMITCAIDAKEKRKVATIDIPGAFMQADQDELVHVRFTGTMAELLAKCDPSLYSQYMIQEKGETVLYVTLAKALYGTLRAAYLFWKLLSSRLIEWGFEINPYDWCVANKVINGSQCTIVWHVDDLKISHAEDSTITEIIDRLKEDFGKEAPLTEKRGKVHDYLGMTLDYRTQGKVRIGMEKYIDDMLEELPADFDGTAATPAAEYLFHVNPDAEALETADKEFYHTNVAKLLFLSRRARPDIQTALSFLTTRVQAPDVDDMKKLRRVMRYLRGTRGITLTLEADNLHIIKWWVDGSFAVHPDMKSHTGGMMSLGRGTIYGTSKRQKLNTRSSTEAELVGVDDCMSQILWTRYFLEAQGYQCDDTVVYQDNQSAILLEKNGRASSSKRTRHINIRYYFVTDRVKSGELRIAYCPTKEMLADFFTKPLQGTLFYKLRSFILNCDCGAGPGAVTSALGPQECVGKPLTDLTENRTSATESPETEPMDKDSTKSSYNG